LDYDHELFEGVPDPCDDWERGTDSSEVGELEAVFDEEMEPGADIEETPETVDIREDEVKDETQDDHGAFEDAISSSTTTLTKEELGAENEPSKRDQTQPGAHDTQEPADELRIGNTAADSTNASSDDPESAYNEAAKDTALDTALDTASALEQPESVDSQGEMPYLPGVAAMESSAEEQDSASTAEASLPLSQRLRVNIRSSGSSIPWTSEPASVNLFVTFLDSVGEVP
jgi:hypothetical protein